MTDVEQGIPTITHGMQYIEGGPVGDDMPTATAVPYGDRLEVETDGTEVVEGADGSPMADEGPQPGIEVERGTWPPPLPEGAITSWNPADDSHVELTVRLGTDTLTIRQEWATGDRDAREVIPGLVTMAEAYLEEDRLTS